MNQNLINKRVYYGEYTLKHWVELMLTKNVTLPEYQRHFVWEESDVRRLMDSLKSGQFIMPGYNCTLYRFRNIEESDS